MIPENLEDFEAVINNTKQELLLLRFHKETLEMKIGYLRPKLESPIKIVSSTDQQTYIPNLKTQWAKEDIPVREDFFHANNELVDVIKAINSKQLMLNRQLETQEEKKAKKIADQQKIKELIDEAKDLLLDVRISKKNKDRLRQDIKTYEKGIRLEIDNTAFYQRLENLIMELR